MILGGLKAASFIIVMTLAAGCAGEKTPEPPKAPPPPPPATGPVAFRASQKAFQGTSQFTLTRVTKTALGVFTETSHVDCAAPYAHWLRTKDLTEKGIAEGTTSLQGRPRAHSEEEKLFVFGLSFDPERRLGKPATGGEQREVVGVGPQRIRSE